MKIEKKDNYTLIAADENSFTAFYDAFLIEEKKIQQENIVIQICDTINTSPKEILLFLDLAQQKKKNGTSFVMINATVDVDDFPDHFNIVPTLQEAEDIIEMEAIERELGF